LEHISRGEVFGSNQLNASVLSLLLFKEQLGHFRIELHEGLVIGQGQSAPVFSHNLGGERSGSRLWYSRAYKPVCLAERLGQFVKETLHHDGVF